MFHTLTEKHVRTIVDLQLALVAERISEKKIILDISKVAKDWLAKKGYDSNLGARPLKRVIQTELLNPLAMQIITGKINEGSKVKIDIEKNKVMIKAYKI